jgi:hypothetical protein
VTEREQARRIAEMWLEFLMNPLTQMVPGDPDCDACVLARQFIRASEALARIVPDTGPGFEAGGMTVREQEGRI